MPRPKRPRFFPPGSPTRADTTEGQSQAASQSGETPTPSPPPQPKIEYHDSPDMRLIATWVIRHLETEVGEELYPAPDPMARTLLAACRSDNKFQAQFISKVFDRMMVQDSAVTGNKFSDDNRDLRDLLDVTESMAARARSES